MQTVRDNIIIDQCTNVVAFTSSKAKAKVKFGKLFRPRRVRLDRQCVCLGTLKSQYARHVTGE